MPKILSKLFVLILCSCFIVGGAFAQKDYSRVYEDFGLWNSIKLDYEPAKKWKVSGQVAVRLNNYASQLRSSYFQATVVRDLKNKWEVASKFRYTYRPNKQSLRISAEVKKYVRFKPFNIKFRSKIDWDYDRRFSENQHDYTWRNRLGLQYKRKKYKLSGEATVEWFHEYDKTLSLPENIRLKTGLNYTINKSHSIGTDFIVQEERNTRDPQRDYVLSLSLNYKLGK